MKSNKLFCALAVLFTFGTAWAGNNTNVNSKARKPASALDDKCTRFLQNLILAFSGDNIDGNPVNLKQVSIENVKAVSSEPNNVGGSDSTWTADGSGFGSSAKFEVTSTRAGCVLKKLENYKQE